MTKWWLRGSAITSRSSPSPILREPCNRPALAQVPSARITRGARTPSSWVGPFWAACSTDRLAPTVPVSPTVFQRYRLPARMTPPVIEVNGYQRPQLISMRQRSRIGMACQRWIGPRYFPVFQSLPRRTLDSWRLRLCVVWDSRFEISPAQSNRQFTVLGFLFAIALHRRL